MKTYTRKHTNKTAFAKHQAGLKKRGAKIYGEIVGYAINSDATDFVLPNPERQAECIELADYKVTNNGTKKDLYEKVERILKKINK